MKNRQLIEEAISIYWKRIARRKEQEGAVVHQQPNKKLSEVKIVDGVPLVILKNVRGVLARISMTPGRSKELR
jgi:hypothetical protein